MSEPSRPDRKGQPTEGGSREHDGSAAPLRSPWPPLAVLLLVAAASTFLVGHSFRFLAVVYRPGDVAQEDVKAAADFLVVDAEATARRQRDAELAAPSVYDFDSTALDAALKVLQDALDPLSARRLPGEGGSRRSVERLLGLSLPVRADRLLATPAARAAVVEEVRAVLQGPYTRGVVANRTLLTAEGRRGVVVRDLVTRQETSLAGPEAVEDFDEIRRRLERSAADDATAALAGRVAASLLRPNLTYNGEETAARRARVRQGVGSVVYKVRRGEMLVREGDRVSAGQAERLRAHAQVAASGRGGSGWVGLYLVVALSLAAVYEFGRFNVKKFRFAPRDLAFLGLVLVLWLALERAGLVVASGLSERVAALPRSAVLYALPMGAAVMAVRVVLNSETSLLFALPFCALAALSWERSALAFFYFLVGGLVGAHRVARACRRVDFLRAGLWMGLSQAALTWGYALLDSDALGAPVLWNAGGALLGGISSGFFALSVIPLAEVVFSYTTDMRLMELASLDHPLLRSLMLRAPGTYHHSLVTGSLAKSAAEAIGARALLASVAACYHDVGKLSKPDYFIENQVGGGNRHDKLAPSMSGLILASHVKEGVDLARRHRLGRDIADIIQQHHGTSLIHYFYSKARRQARPGLDEVQESNYRYPGPKPASREAALVLLADAVEAASRTLPDPRPARIQGLVQTIVNRVFTDGQLDECTLTLQDLHEIARSFTRILNGIHHQRIDYPLSAQKDRKLDGDLDPKRLDRGRDRRAGVAAAAGESLRRLGM
ncbi:MAG: HDIG domain-containing protein [Deltaproteobacteria bacterium]|nr:HDIG domain-containing protein [Deltaproteobacteria bacterium]